ncbi:MAG: TadE/TadG family type IV pilus assembly protein [Microthrixaceae bacterium]
MSDPHHGPFASFRDVARRHRRGERATALVEAALVTPILLMLVFGAIEFGMAFRSYLTVSNSTRDSARFAATLGREADADYQTVAEAFAGLDGARSGDVRKIIIFKATGPNSTTASGTLAACRTASVAGLCNTYTGPDVPVDPAQYGCGPTSVDRFWCPTTRKVAASDPPDYVGVYIEMHYQSLTGFFGLTRDFSDEFIMRLEPHSA